MVCAVMVAIVSLTYGQNVSITGTVKNKKTNTPISGVLVSLEGTTFSTSSDASGKFSLAGLTNVAHEPFATPWVHKSF